VIIKIEQKKIYLIPHDDNFNTYMTNNEANIKYKRRIFRYIREKKPNYIYTLTENNEFLNFIKNDYNIIQKHNCIEEFSNNLDLLYSF
jgi:hypothetical protein